jgi:hypothetical protein
MAKGPSTAASLTEEQKNERKKRGIVKLTGGKRGLPERMNLFVLKLSIRCCVKTMQFLIGYFGVLIRTKPW